MQSSKNAKADSNGDKVHMCTKGWNWGTYELKNDEMEFRVDNSRCFGINYKDIAISNANGKNEVAFEFVQDAEATKGDILCEMRFHVPNNELEKYYEAKDQARRKARADAGKPESGESSEENEEDQNDENNDMTAAKLFDDKIHKFANIGEFAGSKLASVQDLPLIIPRGVYTLDFFSTFAKLHGKTHDYKIQFQDISKVFLLQKPDGLHMVYLLQLDQPLRVGAQLNYFIAMNIEVEREIKIKIKMTPQEITQKYGNKLQPEIEGKMYDVLSTLFQQLVGIKKIIIPGEFKSSRGAKAIGCSVKASEGYLYPLRNSLVFIHKPVFYIKHSEVKHVEFSRTGQGVSRTFDLAIHRLKEGEPAVTFFGIDRAEQQLIVEYFKESGIKMKTVDIEGNKQELTDAGQINPNKAGGGVNPGADHDMEMDDDEEESEDEDFTENDAGSGAASGDDDDDEGDSNGSGQGDSEMVGQGDDIDSDVDKNELKALQKDTGKIDLNAPRPKRNRK